MAWRAYLIDDIKLTATSKFEVNVVYYDDADPENADVSATVPPSVVLHAKVWAVPQTITTAELQANVVSEGQSARSSLARLATARAQVPRGTRVAIP